MGYVLTRQAKRGPRHTAYYRDQRGEIQCAGTYAAEIQAERAWQRAEAAITVGRVGDPRRGRQRFGDYVRDEWFPNHRIERSTR
jgi:hypothetical protein